MVDKNLFLHDLSVVAILKNEAPYLKEWIEYHLLAGVDHFYLYDNDSPDNQVEVVKPFVAAGLVDYMPAPGKFMQMQTYNDAFKRFKFFSRYMAFIDGDEFIFPKSKLGGVSLKSSTKFYPLTRTRRGLRLIGNCSAPTGRKRQICLAASWRDSRGAHRLTGLRMAWATRTSKPLPTRA